MSNPFISPSADAATHSAAPAIDRKAILAANPGVVTSARWFYWIAGLSIINSVMLHSGSDYSFLAGLGFTLMADALFQTMKPIAFAIDALAIAFFVTMGVYACRGHRWAFLVGGVFYALDALIYVLIQAWLPVIFHGWALFSLWSGGMHLHREIKARLAPPALPAAELAAATSADTSEKA